MNLKNLTKTAFFVVLMIIGAFINISFGSPVPFTLQTLFMLMAGIIIGYKYGALSQIVYVLLGLFGLPIFTQGKGGFAALLSPTFGFLLGFILAAFVTGLLFKKLTIKNSYVKGVISTLIGAAIVYLPGILYFYVVQNVIVNKPYSLLTIAGFMVPFFIPDIIKAIAAGVLGVLIRNALIKRQLLDIE